MTDAAPEGITVQATMTRQDYARYFAVMRRRNSNWRNTVWYAGAFFMAVPVALLFRSLGQRLAYARPDAELIGQFSLAAFLLGMMTIVLAAVIARRLAFGAHVDNTLNAMAPKTVLIDATGITTTGLLSEAKWRWLAISRLTLENDLVLVWIAGSSALAIPDRSFASPAARDAAIAYIRDRLLEANSASLPPTA